MRPNMITIPLLTIFILFSGLGYAKEVNKVRKKLAQPKSCMTCHKTAVKRQLSQKELCANSNHKDIPSCQRPMIDNKVND